MLRPRALDLATDKPPSIDGRRQARTSGGSTTGFVWDTAGSLPLLLDDGTHAYLYGPGNAPIAQVDDSTGTTEYLHGDLLGSTRLVTDSTGTATGAYRYDAYGTVTAHTGTATTRMQYTGAWTDPDTHLVYLRARDYDPTTGQFLQVDPALHVTHQPYTYVDNNPLVSTDPTGLYKRNDTSPLELGLQWLTGLGPRHQEFHAGDPLTEQLRQHDQIQQDRNAIRAVLEEGAYQPGKEITAVGNLSYRLGGIDGVAKYIKDYSTIVTLGKTGNLTVTYLGSYNVTATALQGAYRNCVNVQFTVTNTSSFASSVHLPLYGLIPGYHNVEKFENSLFPKGPLSPTTQTITWTEGIRW